MSLKAKRHFRRMSAELATRHDAQAVADNLDAQDSGEPAASAELNRRDLGCLSHMFDDCPDAK